MRFFGWTVLAAVFAVELAAFAAYAVWGWAHSPRLLLSWLAPMLAILAWGLCAAPRARFSNPPARVATRVLVLGFAVLALATSGHRVAAATMLVVALVAHALAALPSVRALQTAGAPMGPELPE